MRTLILSSFVFCGTLAVTGCTADAEKEVSGSDEQRTSVAIDPAIDALIGSYTNASVPVPNGVLRLNLEPNGEYTALRDMSMSARCASDAPCVSLETGTWALETAIALPKQNNVGITSLPGDPISEDPTSKSSDIYFSLHLKPNGQAGAPLLASRNDEGIKLYTSNGTITLGRIPYQKIEFPTVYGKN